MKTRHLVKHLNKRKVVKRAAKSLFWFLTGAFLGLFFLGSFGYIISQQIFSGKIYPGVSVEQIDFGGKTPAQVQAYFDKKNTAIQQSTFTFIAPSQQATISAKELQVGYDSKLLADQAYNIGRSTDTLSNMYLIIQAFTAGIDLPASYHYASDILDTKLSSLKKSIAVQPIDAIFTVDNGKVTAFRPSSDGRSVDNDGLQRQVNKQTAALTQKGKTDHITIAIPIKVVKPAITTERVNSLGIKELIGEGTSLFEGSIPGRIHNVALAASRVNGVLVAPGETFSFDKALGDVSAFTGYKQAYIIQNGHTVLGDGGGVCQVSTTFFRAVLNAGLPVVERHAHAYRVHYYEEDGPPGIDATVYYPSVDFKFKNDTKHYILIQSKVDLNTLRLTYYLYGTKDGREVSMTTPVITSQTPPPPPLYQDDPTLPAGTIKQTDFEAWGARVQFARTVTKNGKTLISETYISNYQPWQAVYLRGTQ